MNRNPPMKAHAATFALLMIASSLAGCTTAGNDGVPEITLDDEDIETFLDDYFQDFVNNSSVVINQEIHYHNETTDETSWDRPTADADPDADADEAPLEAPPGIRPAV